jgi:hypothetical protein
MDPGHALPAFEPSDLRTKLEFKRLLQQLRKRSCKGLEMCRLPVDLKGLLAVIPKR